VVVVLTGGAEVLDVVEPTALVVVEPVVVPFLYNSILFPAPQY